MLNRWKSSPLFRNTLSTFAGMGMRIGIQGVYFILIARSLGTDGYGAFIGTVSLVLLFVPFASFGTGNLLVKHVSRDPGQFPVCWGNALLVTAASGGLLSLVAAGVSLFLLPPSVPVLLVLLISVSDLIFARTVDVCVQVYQAFEWMKGAAVSQVWLSGARLLAALALMWLVSDPEPADWGWFYCLSSLMAFAVCVAEVIRRYGRPKADLRLFLNEWKEGFFFSVSFASLVVYGSIDKILLTRLAALEASGIYAAAWRIIEVALSPVMSLLMASYARFFRKGSEGLSGSAKLMVRLFPHVGVLGLGAGGLTWLLAPVIPRVLGGEYAGAVEAIRWLALLPFLKACHTLLANALTGAGYQGIRSLIQAAGALVCTGLNLWLIPLASWKGAAVSALLTEGMLALTFGAVIAGMSRRKRSISHSNMSLEGKQ